MIRTVEAAVAKLRALANEAPTPEERKAYWIAYCLFGGVDECSIPALHALYEKPKPKEED